MTNEFTYFEEITLHNLSQDYKKSDGVSGVYVWGYIETNRMFIPLYAGKSRNVFERLIQHYCRFKAGEYSMFNRQDLIDNYCNNQKTVPRKIYEPTNFRTVLDLAISTDHCYMLKNFLFRYTDVLEEELRRQAEIYLADIIDRKYLITTISKGNSGSLSESRKSLLEQMVRSQPSHAAVQSLCLAHIGDTQS